MTAIQKQAVKDLLHLLIDKEQDAVIKELLGKLPAPYGAIALSIFGALDPVMQAGEDAAVNKI